MHIKRKLSSTTDKNSAISLCSSTGHGELEPFFSHRKFRKMNLSLDLKLSPKSKDFSFRYLIEIP